MQESVEEALSSQILTDESVITFTEKEDRAYKEAKCSDEQNVLFIQMAAFVEQKVRSFVIFHKPWEKEIVVCLKNLVE